MRDVKQLIFGCLMMMTTSQIYAAGNVDDSARSINYFTGLRPYTVPIDSTSYANELGIDGALSYVSDLESYWNYSSLHYYRMTHSGTYGGRINSASRFGSRAVQYQAEAYPVLYQGAYAALSIAYANTTQTLFASYQYRAEAYFPLPYKFEVSLGQGGQHFPRFNNKNILMYTGSLGKYMNDYFLWVRPFYFTPKSAFLLEVGLRKTFNDPDRYISMRASQGHLPDIGDLPPLDNLITLNQTALGIGGQLPLSHNVFGKLDVSYAHQAYPAGLIRNISTLFLGLFVRF